MIVAFSAGKDSLACLDLVAKRYTLAGVYFMYHVKGMSFQEDVIRWAEQRYKIEVLRVPHFDLARIMNRGGLRKPGAWLPETKIKDVEDGMRNQFSCDWIASGESKFESLQRRGMLSAMGDSSVSDGVFDAKRQRYYPISDWNRSVVFSYLKRNRIPVPAFYRYMDQSFGRLRADELAAVHDHYPEDYERILRVFPFADAVRLRSSIHPE